MEAFFSRSGYSDTDRKRVEGYPDYIKAAKAQDIASAQAIACEALEGCGHTKAQAKKDRSGKHTVKACSSFMQTRRLSTRRGSGIRGP